MWYDGVVLAILIYATIRGAKRGVVWQLAGIAGLVLCVVFAETISHAASPYVGLQEPLNQWVVMFAAYLVFSFLSFGVARLLHDWIEKAQLKEYNQHLGAVFGLVKGVAICLVLTFFIVTLSDEAREALKHSRSGRYAAILMDRLHPVMPEKLHDALEKYIHQLDDPSLDLRHSHHHAHDHSHADGSHDHAHDHSGTAGGGGGGGGGSLEEVLASIPNLISGELRGAVEEALLNTSPEDWPELIERLRSARPEAIPTIAGQWRDGNPHAGAGAGAGAEVNPATPTEKLIEQISAAYSEFPSGRAQIAAQIEMQLRGLPDQVVQGVLLDWRADLSGGQESDPDPETSVETTVDQRIIRQLTIHRVSVWSLSEALQKRLMEAVQR